MWSVCSGFLSDRLVWSPAVVLLRPVRSRLSFSVHVLVIGGLSLDSRMFASAVIAQPVAVSSLP